MPHTFMKSKGSDTMMSDRLACHSRILRSQPQEAYHPRDMEDPELRQIVNSAVEETSALIVKKHGIPEAEQKEYREKIIKRISNPYLEDLPERVGRAPLRKLGRKERFIGPAAPLAEMGLPHSTLLGAIEMAFRFHNVTDDKGQIDDESVELERILKQKSANEVVQQVCGLTEKDKLYSEVVEIVKKVQG